MIVMINNIIRCIVVVLTCMLLGGCWNYVGLNELTIVAGIGIDKDKDNNKYILTFEIIDLMNSNKDEGIRSKIIQSEGDTIFEAARNAKKLTSTKLYYSNTQTVVVSEDIAKNDGLYSILDWFIKDAETRETINFAIAQGASAADIISQKGVTNSVNSYEMREIIQKDQEVTLSTRNVVLYQIYDVLKSKSNSLVLPAFHITEFKGETSAEVNGLATFKKDKLYKYLTPDESRYYLFVVDQVKGGVIPFSSKSNDKSDVTYEISKSNTKIYYKMKKNKLKFKIKVNIEGFLAEYDTEKMIKGSKDILKLQKTFSKELKDRIKSVIKKCQDENYPDFFEFGQKIYETNQKLWKKVKNNWNTRFKSIDVDVSVNVKILNTAFTK